MRGNDTVAGSLFSYVDLEHRVRAEHPLWVIRDVVNATLQTLSSEFDALYPPFGRESIPSEWLLRALLLQAFYSIRSERQLVERLDFDLLFRWFVGLGVDDPVWDPTTFTKNRDRLLAGDVAVKFLAAILAQPKVRALLSSEHFSVDGTLLDAWASTKSFRPKDSSGLPPDGGRNGEQDFHGQQRGNDTHASTTDPDTRLYRRGRGKEAKLAFMGHALMENRNGLIVGAVATRASGHTERLAALHLVQSPPSGSSRLRSAATKASIPATSSPNSVRSTSPRTWRGTPAGGGPPSMAAPRATPATRSACASASGSKKHSAGPRRWPGCARHGIAGCPRSTGSSPSSWPPTIWWACRNCWQWPRDTRSQPERRRRTDKGHSASRRAATDSQIARPETSTPAPWRHFSAAC